VGCFCGNRSLQQGKYARVKLVVEGPKQWGVRVQERIEKGQFVLEYTGEIINKTQFNIRRASNKNSDKYVIKLRQWYIDAITYGNESRFINHSCDPNCEAKVIQVGKKLRVGIYALKTIHASQFLSIDYGWKKSNEVCRCGSHKCTGRMSGT
jgi:SET domain-containing protein